MGPPALTQAEQMSRVSELRSRIDSEIQDGYFKSDGYLLSWLEEKKFKVEKAETAIKKTMQWRQEHKIDSVVSETFDDSWIPVKPEFIGHDLDNRPVLVMHPKDEAVGEAEIEAALKRATKDKVNTIRYFYAQAELVRNAIAIAAENCPAGDKQALIKSVVVICDLGSFKVTDYTKYAKLAFPIAHELFKMAEEFYPGILHQCYIINAPKKTVRLVLTMLRPVIKSNILDKFKVFGKKQDKWAPVLLQAVSKDQLLKRYGGTK